MSVACLGLVGIICSLLMAKMSNRVYRVNIAILEQVRIKWLRAAKYKYKYKHAERLLLNDNIEHILPNGNTFGPGQLTTYGTRLSIQ